MSSTDTAAPAPVWFRDLLETADDVYFRYSLVPSRGFVYISPSIEALTGETPQALVDNPSRCFSLLAGGNRRVLRRILRARRALTIGLHIVRGGVHVPVEVRTVAVIRGRRLTAIEGVARFASGTTVASSASVSLNRSTEEPAPQRLAALMYEVHDLLHRVLPPRGPRLEEPTRAVRVGDLVLDLDRLTVSDQGALVTLTSRELMLLRYFVLRPHRVVTRAQLLTDVWGYQYTGDDRTVDVHVSRLRRKLPSLGGRLVAVKHVGYRLETDEESERQIANS